MVIVTLVDVAKGYRDLLLSPVGATDVNQRWAEQRYVFNGQNPFDVLQAAAVFPGYGAPAWSERNVSVIPEVGVPAGTSYPPWSFFLGNALYWPAASTIRIYFAFIEAVALACIYLYGFWIGGRGGSSRAGVIVGLAAVSISSVTTTISLGQFGLIAVAALAAVECFSWYRRPVLAGLALSIALCKPNIAGMFVLPFIVRLTMRTRRRDAAVTLGAAGASVVLASLVTGWQTHTNPIEMTLQWLRISKFLSIEPLGFIESLVDLGLSPSSASLVALLGWFAIGTALIFFWRRSNLLTQFAIACLAGRFWSYHRMYDNVMLAFLMIGLAKSAFTDQNLRAMPAFLLTAFSVWLPVHFVIVSVANVQHLIWLLALFTILRLNAKDEEEKPTSANAERLGPKQLIAIPVRY